MKNPKISIITISYNSVSTIERTIESVVSQDYSNKEYIVIDGFSTDGTQNIVKKYESLIDVFISEKDNGRSDAFNKGIRLATGDIIVLLNSDDYMLPKVLKSVSLQYDGITDIYCGNMILWNKDTDLKCRIIPSLRFPKLPFFCRPNHQGLFITKEIYNELGYYDVNLNYAMDLDFLMRATALDAKFKYINIDIAVFRLGGATSDSIFKKRKEYIYLIMKNGGTKMQAYFFYIFLIITQTIRNLLNLSDFDLIRRIRYKQTT